MVGGIRELEVIYLETGILEGEKYMHIGEEDAVGRWSVFVVGD